MHWQGWHGEKRWEAYEAELLLRATADSTGHIYLAVRLRGHSWQLKGALVLEAGQLESVAADMERFVQNTPVGLTPM